MLKYKTRIHRAKGKMRAGWHKLSYQISSSMAAVRDGMSEGKDRMSVQDSKSRIFPKVYVFGNFDSNQIFLSISKGFLKIPAYFFILELKGRGFEWRRLWEGWRWDDGSDGWKRSEKARSADIFGIWKVNLSGNRTLIQLCLFFTALQLFLGKK